MEKVNVDQILELITGAINMTTVGHMALDYRYQDEGTDKRNSHYRRKYYKFCYLLTQLAKPDIVVELGIDEGDCSGHFAFARPETTVLGVDVHKDPVPHLTIHPSTRCHQMEQAFNNFKYLRGWTWDMLREVKKYPPIDLLFIDSWHEYDYFARDWNDYAPLLADYSIVLVDDLHMGPVKNAFDELSAEWRITDTEMNPANCFGILINPDKTYRFTHEKMEFMT